MPRYSEGAFSRVFFMMDRYGLGTFTFRKWREVEAGSQVSVISSISDGGPAFGDVFVRTSDL